MVANALDTVERQRVGTHESVLAVGRPQILAAELLQKVQQAARGDAGLIHVAECRLIGGAFLRSAIGQIGTAGHFRAAAEYGGARSGFAGREGGADAEQRAQKIAWAEAPSMASCVRIRCPPAMWPISCATTPINSPGLSLS